MTTDEQINLLKIENLQLELEIKKVEMLSKQNEIDNIKVPKRKITLEQATIFVAIIGFIGSFLGNAVQGFFSLKQKEQEFEAALITRAVEAGDSSLSRRNLKFLTDAGLVNDRYGKIKNIVSDTSYALPSFSAVKNVMPDRIVYKTPGGSKYHMPNCSMLSNISEEITIEKASELGLLPCKICKPLMMRQQ